MYLADAKVEKIDLASVFPFVLGAFQIFKLDRNRQLDRNR